MGRTSDQGEAEAFYHPSSPTPATPAPSHNPGNACSGPQGFLGVQGLWIEQPVPLGHSWPNCIFLLALPLCRLSPLEPTLVSRAAHPSDKSSHQPLPWSLFQMLESFGIQFFSILHSLVFRPRLEHGHLTWATRVCVQAKVIPTFEVCVLPLHGSAGSLLMPCVSVQEGNFTAICVTQHLGPRRAGLVRDARKDPTA